MSELKSRKFFEAVPTSKAGFYQPGAFVDGYLKSEVDKVIAHHKYNRCLAKAMWCESEEKRLEAISPIFDTDKECWEYNSDYWGNWHDYWLAIAEKFKEHK